MKFIGNNVAGDRIRNRILIPLGFVLLSLIAAALFGFSKHISNRLDGELLQQIKGVEGMFQNVLNHDAKLIRGLLDFIEKDHCIRNAWQIKDREKLLHCASPVFKNIRAKYRVTHFYFHDLEQVNFLRVHNPARFGDNIGRFTMQQAVNTGKTVHGIELGPFGTFTLRVVQPWRIEGKLAGYIELGEEIEHITPEISKTLNMALVLLIDKQHLDRPKWEEGQKMMWLNGNWDQLQEAVVIDHTDDFDPASLKEHLSQNFNGQATTFDITLQASKHRGGVLPLIDAGGKTLGKLIVLKDITQELEQINQLSVQLIELFILISGSLYLFLWFFLGHIESKHKQAAKELQESEQRFRQVSENSAEWIWEIDARGRYTYSNSFVTDMLGYQPEELNGRHFWDFFVPEQQEIVEKQAREMFAQKQSFHRFANTLVNKEGLLVEVETSGSPFLDDDGKLLGYRGVDVDITDLKASQSQLIQQEKMASIGQLAAGVAHEINTPTQFVSDNTHFIQEAFADYNRLFAAYDRLIEVAASGAVPDDLVTEIQKLKQEVDVDYLKKEVPQAVKQSMEGLARIANIVRAMKEFSHPGTDEKTPTDLNSAIMTTIDISRNEWKYCADLITELYPDLPQVPVLLGKFNQVILNIIVNAAHAIIDVVGTTGEKGEIRITSQHDGEWVKICISDTGKGMPQAIQKRIFDPFYTTKEIGKGTGQGLAIAWSVIVDKHSGSIEVESEENKGSIFTIRLPITQDTSS